VRVLVVEDEAELASVVAGYFTRDGYEVRVAHDGAPRSGRRPGICQRG
jgi:DNA-binding response OmpR family regulator